MPSTISDDDGERGTGRTTRQIKSCPQGALYIVPNGAMVSWTRRLAFDLGRTDLTVASLDNASRYDWERTRGKRGTGTVTLDHACWQFMSRAMREQFSELQHAYEW